MDGIRIATWYHLCHHLLIYLFKKYRVTKEHRENLAKNAKSMFHKYKDSLRDIHNRHVRDVKKKDKLFSSDLIFSVLQQIQALTEQYSADGEKTMLAKQNELLGRD